MKYELKTIAVWPFLRVAVLINTTIGFIGGIFYALFFNFFFSLLMNMPGGLADELGGKPDLPTGIFIVIFPIMFAFIGGVFYTLLELLFILLYNLFASFAGGFEVVLVAKQEAQPMPSAPPQQYYANYSGYSQPSGFTPPPPPPPPQQPPQGPENNPPQGN